MTEEEFNAKQEEWGRRLEDFLIEIVLFKNHKGFSVLTPPATPVTEWFTESMKYLKASLQTDDAMLAPMYERGASPEDLE